MRKCGFQYLIFLKQGLSQADLFIGGIGNQALRLLALQPSQPLLCILKLIYTRVSVFLGEEVLALLDSLEGKTSYQKVMTQSPNFYTIFSGFIFCFKIGYIMLV
ncbi:MAG: hypothetical protein ACFFCW_10435, partial [Candidatus Hodarchaeota archaeon]